MASLNSVVLIGRLTRNPELRATPTGTSVTTITLAVDRSPAKGSNQETDFIDCVFFGQTADAICKYLAKGKLVAVEGRIQTRTYETKDGQKRKAVEVFCQSIQFLSPKEQAE